jgi:hypothetical protein
MFVDFNGNEAAYDHDSNDRNEGIGFWYQYFGASYTGPSKPFSCAM